MPGLVRNVGQNPNAGVIRRLFICLGGVVGKLRPHGASEIIADPTMGPHQSRPPRLIKLLQYIYNNVSTLEFILE